ncbi:methyltransferase [Halomonas alkaliantarctica]|nr:methyltransferase [Halomonas alkaliantarctica]
MHLTHLLARWQPLWRPLPFQHPVLPWEADYPELGAMLRSLTDEDCARLEDDPFTDSPLARWLPVEALAELVTLPALSARNATKLPEAWCQHVGGRKWQQIEAFAERLAFIPGQKLVEWCAGKGHLSRTLARLLESEVSALEWQQALCDQGQALAERQGVALRMCRQDVLAPEVADALEPDSHLMALHACGDLHVRLLELAAERGNAVTLAPCCYQRTAAEHYRPLSREGRRLCERFGLSLSREDLALAVQETVTAPRNVRLNRQKASAWRLGFDGLQRELRGLDAYLPVPSLAYGALPSSFEGFCHWAADRKAITLPDGIDWVRHEQAGWRRHGEVARLELVRHLFRRPLEVWLARDRARMLEESGLAVELGTFCKRSLTPRNLMLRARAPA